MTEAKSPRGADWALVLVWFYVECALAMAAVLGLGWLLGPKGAWALPACFLYVLVQLLRRLWKLKKRGAQMWAFGVIAVLGLIFLPCVLALAILAPGFQRYQHKALQTEAKMALSVLYTGEMAYRADNGKFTFDFDILNYSGPDKRNYAVGFPLACADKYGAKVSFVPTQGSELAAGREAEIQEYFVTAKKAAECKDPAQGFELYAVGVSAANKPLDVWRIDEERKLEHVQGED
jgi:hypothetical protein